MNKSFETKHFGSASLEFRAADFGDKRLQARLMKLANSMASNPTESFSKLLGDGADSEGAYRFLRNERVNFEGILEPHRGETVLRSKLEKKVLVLHDTTEIKFSTSREGLGWLRHSKSKKNGFFSHFSLVVSPKEQRPLGIVAAEISINTGPKKGYQSPAKRKEDKTRKSLRWMRGVEITEQALGPTVEAIHVSDREADFFEYFSKLKDRNSKHITRVSRDRLILDSELERSVSLFEKLKQITVKFQREVPLSARKSSPLPSKRKIHPERQKRIATLSITATEVELKRTHHNDSSLNSSLFLNVVHVFEENTPQGEPAVDWKLFTTEPIDTHEQIAEIVDNYRTRWLIEEFNKALKTGCAFEERQLESKQTILNALALFIPIAYRLLLLRSEARQRPNAAATIVLTPIQIIVLKAMTRIPLSENPTVSQAMLSIANLGGHLRRNGPPGWQVLSKGFSDLLTYEKAWIAFKRCDQS